MSAADSDQPTFFYDLGTPDCYLAAEAILSALPIVPEWEPVHAASVCDGVGALDGRDRGPDAVGAHDGLGAPDRERIERRAAELGLQPWRWPEIWPPDSWEAALAATYAKRVGRAVVFSLAAFRQEFAGGRDIGDRNTVLIAGAACEMHPTALVKGIGLRSTAEGLDRANQRAREAGVRSLPAIAVHGRVYEGERSVDLAAAALQEPG